MNSSTSVIDPVETSETDTSTPIPTYPIPTYPIDWEYGYPWDPYSTSKDSTAEDTTVTSTISATGTLTSTLSSSSDLSSPTSPVDSTATPTVTVIVDPPLITSSTSSGVTVDPITGSSSPAINSSATATVTSVIFDPSLTGTSSSLNSTDTADGVTGSSSFKVIFPMATIDNHYESIQFAVIVSPLKHLANPPECPRSKIYSKRTAVNRAETAAMHVRVIFDAPLELTASLPPPVPPSAAGAV
ncbi:MAG: hypothetical protein Q9215_001215 [Flavoplaca cf. flavocitrina]